MKKTELVSLRAKTQSELAKVLSDKRKELAKASVKIVGGSEKNLKKAALLRKDIAQVATIQREKQILGKEGKGQEKLVLSEVEG